MRVTIEIRNTSSTSTVEERMQDRTQLTAVFCWDTGRACPRHQIWLPALPSAAHQPALEYNQNLSSTRVARSDTWGLANVEWSIPVLVANYAHFEILHQPSSLEWLSQAKHSQYREGILSMATLLDHQLEDCLWRDRFRISRQSQLHR